MSKSPDPNEVDLTDMVRVNDDEFDPNAVDYHPEGSPVDEFATQPMSAPSAGAPGDDDDKFDPDLGDDTEDFPDPDLSLLDDFLSEDDDECLERTGDIDDEDITGEAQADDVDNIPDGGPLCLSEESSIDDSESGGNHCGPIALMDNLSEFMNSIPMSADELRPTSEVVIRSNGVRQTFAEFLSELPDDYSEPGSIEIND